MNFWQRDPLNSLSTRQDTKTHHFTPFHYFHLSLPRLGRFFFRCFAKRMFFAHLKRRIRTTLGTFSRKKDPPGLFLDQDLRPGGYLRDVCREISQLFETSLPWMPLSDLEKVSTAKWIWTRISWDFMDGRSSAIEIFRGFLFPRCSMGLAYLPTKLGSFWGKCR